MWPRADNPPADRQTAIVDLGSNSVRLVIYRVEGRAIWTIFNEKALAGLGRDLPATGRLSSEGVEVAMAALRRFRTVLDGWRPEDISVAATAAVREAADGPAFVRHVREHTGFEVRVLTGEEEARYAAMGVLAGDPLARGVVGDLGGSSLELINIDESGPGDGVSLPLGPFALGAPRALDIERTRRAIERELTPVAGRFASQRFNAVGGAWRNLALLHMELAAYPLRIAHQYEMSRADALDVARFVERQSKSSLERIEGLSKKRIETLPYSALVLEAVVERLGVERVVISAYGVREGLLLESMPAAVRRQDPLIAGCEAAAAARGLVQDLGGALEAWLTPAFEKLAPLFGPGRDALLLAAACRLADLGARLHPDHRADIAFQQVLRAPVAGVSHPERAFLAHVAFSRHTASTSPPEAGTLNRILSAERRQRARAMGAAIRLGCDLSGRNPQLLEKSSLSLRGDRVVLTAGAGWEDMLLGEQTAKRAQTLASALKLRLEIA
jgi:exopolyphosphatase / guanosine-5'-triphosphate,3'-diphosphate pyrophosphatase